MINNDNLKNDASYSIYLNIKKDFIDNKNIGISKINGKLRYVTKDDIYYSLCLKDIKKEVFTNFTYEEFLRLVVFDATNYVFYNKTQTKNINDVCNIHFGFIRNFKQFLKEGYKTDLASFNFIEKPKSQQKDFFSQMALNFSFKIEISYKKEVYSLNRLVANGYILKIDENGYLVITKKDASLLTFSALEDFDYLHYLKKPFHKQKIKINKGLDTWFGVFSASLPYLTLLLKGAFLEILNKNSQEFTDRDSQKLLLSNLGNNIINCYIQLINKSIQNT